MNRSAVVFGIFGIIAIAVVLGGMQIDALWAKIVTGIVAILILSLGFITK